MLGIKEVQDEALQDTIREYSNPTPTNNR
jgi:hypothetical protein